MILTCSDDKNSEVIKIFYNQDRIETLGKTFTNVLIFEMVLQLNILNGKLRFLDSGSY